MKNKLKSARTFGIWSGHIPEKYQYNPRLPKGNTFMAWFNMYSPLIQNGMRKSVGQRKEQVERYVPPKGINMQKYTVVSDGTAVNMYCLEPEEIKGRKDCPVLFYIHGGAFYFPLTVDGLNSMVYYAKELNVRVFLPDYRVSTEQPFPGPLLDCYNCILYLGKNSEKLGIDPHQILIYGDSAGGCLVAALTHYIRDFGGPKVRGQMLVYPVVDNSLSYPSMKKYRDAPWPFNANENMWDIYLKDGDKGMLKYAAPLRSDDFSSLPEAYVEVAEIDVLCDEGTAYAQKLKKNGIPVTSYIVPGGYHGYDADQKNEFVAEMLKKRVKIMKEMLGRQNAEKEGNRECYNGKI